jgi:hypothetical protein
LQPGQKSSLNPGLAESAKPKRALGAVSGIRKIEAIIESLPLNRECKDRMSDSRNPFEDEKDLSVYVCRVASTRRV